jgi:hypothetical protein
VFYYAGATPSASLNVLPAQKILSGSGKAGPLAVFEVLPDDANGDGGSAGSLVRIRAPTGRYVRITNALGEPRPSVDAASSDREDPGTLLRLRWHNGAGGGAPPTVTIESAILEVRAMCWCAVGYLGKHLLLQSC